jgi:hypothetical protein
MKWVALLLATSMLVSGCVIPGTGGVLQVKVTDQSENITSLILMISQVKVLMAENVTVKEQAEGQEVNETYDYGWIDVAGPNTVDLIKVKGVEELLGETALPEGRYNQIRLTITSATVTIDGVAYNLKIPSNSIKFVHSFEIKRGVTTALLLDFDADKSVVKAGDRYILKPVVKISTEGEKVSLDGACTTSGGNVTVQMCCKSAEDFPSTCLIGACGCSPENSHEVKVCDCGEGKCWDSNQNTCVGL